MKSLPLFPEDKDSGSFLIKIPGAIRDFPPEPKPPIFKEPKVKSGVMCRKNNSNNWYLYSIF